MHVVNVQNVERNLSKCRLQLLSWENSFLSTIYIICLNHSMSLTSEKWNDGTNNCSRFLSLFLAETHWVPFMWKFEGAHQFPICHTADTHLCHPPHTMDCMLIWHISPKPWQIISMHITYPTDSFLTRLVPDLVSLEVPWRYRIWYHLRYRGATGFGITWGTATLPDLVSPEVPQCYRIWYQLRYRNPTGFGITWVNFFEQTWPWKYSAESISLKLSPEVPRRYRI